VLLEGTRDDAELVAAVRCGDGEAVTALYEHHVGAVRFVIRDRVRTPDLVEELVQETFTRSLERLDGLRRPDRFRPWLLSIARNVATDRQRLEQRQVGVDDDVLERRLGPVEAPEVLAGQRALAEQVGDALDRLAPRDALALGLGTHLGMTPSELAVVLDVTPNAAKVVVHRARRRLRDLLVADALADAPAQACESFRSLASTSRLRHVGDCPTCLSGGRSLLGLVEDEVAA
jgi:RNA polymerase sigma factor (sigma-70 family)